MPSHQIHIGIGQELNKYYNFDKDLFYLGCILPDLGENHFISHFKKNHREYDYERFINNYYDKNNPVIVGYLVHILSDDYFNKYVRENHYLHDDKLYGIKYQGKVFYGTPREVTDKKQAGFYDYEHYLLNNKKIPKLDYVDLQKLTKINECSYDDKYIKEYIDTHNELIKKDDYEITYEIFTFDELDKLYKGSIEYIKKYLDNLNIKLENNK